MALKKGYGFLPTMRDVAAAITATLEPASCGVSQRIAAESGPRTKGIAA